jgi:hypothetical protein
MSTGQHCAIDITYLAAIFMVDKPNEVTKKLKISCQTDEPFERYSRYKYKYSTKGRGRIRPQIGPPVFSHLI